MPGRIYEQSFVTLSFPNNGPSYRFRINPDSVDWSFRVKTAVIDTLGGRVIQVLGADVTDMTVQGSFGSRQSKDAYWKDAEEFVTAMRKMIAHQSSDVIGQGKMHAPAVFSFPAQGWRFAVYIKSVTDGGEASAGVEHTAGKFIYRYALTFSIYNDLSNTTNLIGQSNGTLAKAKDAAVQGYIDRIADGIGWKASNYNGPDAASTILGQDSGTSSVGGTVGSGSGTSGTVSGGVGGESGGSLGGGIGG